MPPKKRRHTHVDLTKDEGHKAKKAKSNEENEKHKANKSNKSTSKKSSHNSVSVKVKTENESWNEGTIFNSKSSENQAHNSTVVSARDKHFNNSTDEDLTKKQPRSRVNVRPRRKVQQNCCVDSENAMPKLMKHTTLSEEHGSLSKSKNHTGMSILLPERSQIRSMPCLLSETRKGESGLAATSSFSNIMITNEVPQSVHNKPCARVKPKLKKDSGQRIYVNATQFSSRNCVLPYLGPESVEVMKRQFDQICTVCYSIHVRGGSLSACPLAQPIRCVSNNPGSLQGHAAPLDVYISCSRVYESRLSLFAHKAIPERTQFGPLEGRMVEGNELATIKLRDIDTRHYWPISTERELENGRFSDVTISAYLDTTVEDCSNWLRFLVPEHVSALEALPDSPLKANIQRVTREGEIYFVTLRDIRAGEELFLAPMEPPERAFFNLPSLYYNSEHDNMALSRYMNNCQYCAKRLCDEFPFSSTLHMMRHHNMLHKYVPGSLRIAHIWQCYLCGVESHSTNQLEKHYEHSHPAVRRLQCPYCGVTRNNAKQMTSHFTVEHAKASEYQCAECNMSFEHYYDVRLHRDQVHSTSDDRTCEHCGQQFKSLTSKKHHIKFVHEKSRVHACEECGQQFKDKYQLKVHSQRHSGLKPYQCQDCSKSLSTKQALIRHYASRHDRAEVTIPPVSRVTSTPAVRQRRMVKTIYIEQAQNHDQSAVKNQPCKDKARKANKPSETQRSSNRAEKNKTYSAKSTRNENSDSRIAKDQIVDSEVEKGAIDNYDSRVHDTINTVNRFNNDSKSEGLQSELNEHRTRNVRSKERIGRNVSNISEQKNTFGNKKTKAKSRPNKRENVLHAKSVRSDKLTTIAKTLTKHGTSTTDVDVSFVKNARAQSSRETTFENGTGATKGRSRLASASHKHFKCIDCPLSYFTKQALDKHFRVVHEGETQSNVPLGKPESLVITPSRSGICNTPRDIQHSVDNINLVSTQTDAFTKKNISIYRNNQIGGINNVHIKLKHDVTPAKLDRSLSPSLSSVELNESNHSACSVNSLENRVNNKNGCLHTGNNSYHPIQNGTWINAHSNRKSGHGVKTHDDGGNVALNALQEQVDHSAAALSAGSDSDGFDYDVDHDESYDVLNYEQFEQGLSKRSNLNVTAKHDTVTLANTQITRNYVLQKLREKINSRKDKNSILTSEKTSRNLESKEQDPMRKKVKPKDKTYSEVKILQKPKEKIVIDLLGAQSFDPTEEEVETLNTDMGMDKSRDDISQTVETVKTETLQGVPMLSVNSENLSDLQNYQIINEPKVLVPIVQNSVQVPLQYLNTGIVPAIPQSVQVPHVPMYFTDTTFLPSAPTVNYVVNDNGYIAPVNIPPPVIDNMQNTLLQNTMPIYNGASSNVFFIPKVESPAPTPALETAMQQSTLPLPYNQLHPQVDMPNALLFSNAEGEIFYVQANDEENNEPVDLSISPKKAGITSTETVQIKPLTQPVRSPTQIEHALHYDDREPLTYSMRPLSPVSVPSAENMTQLTNICKTQTVSENLTRSSMASPSRESSSIIPTSSKTPASIVASSVIISPKNKTSYVSEASSESDLSVPYDESHIPMESIASITRITSFIPITTNTSLPSEPLPKYVHSSVTTPHGLSEAFNKETQENTITVPLKNCDIQCNLNQNIKDSKCDANNSISVQLKAESIKYTQLKPFTSKVSESQRTTNTDSNESEPTDRTVATEEDVLLSSDNIPTHVQAESLSEVEIRMILNRYENSDSLSMNNDIRKVNNIISDKAPNPLSPSKHTRIKTRGSKKQPSANTFASSISDSNSLNDFEPAALKTPSASKITVLRKQPHEFTNEQQARDIKTKSQSEAKPESQYSVELDSRHSIGSNIDTDSQNDVIDSENETDPPERIASIWRALNKLSTTKAATPVRDTKHDDFFKAFEKETQHMSINNFYVESSFDVSDSIAEAHETGFTDSVQREDKAIPVDQVAGEMRVGDSITEAHETDFTDSVQREDNTLPVDQVAEEIPIGDSIAEKHETDSTDSVQREDKTLPVDQVAGEMPVGDSITEEHETNSTDSVQREDKTLPVDQVAEEMQVGDSIAEAHETDFTDCVQREDNTLPVDQVAGEMPVGDSIAEEHETNSTDSVQREDKTPSVDQVAGEMPLGDSIAEEHETNSTDSVQREDKTLPVDQVAEEMRVGDSIAEAHETDFTDCVQREDNTLPVDQVAGEMPVGDSITEEHETDSTDNVQREDKTLQVDPVAGEMPGSSDWATIEDAALASFISGGFM